MKGCTEGCTAPLIGKKECAPGPPSEYAQPAGKLDLQIKSKQITLQGRAEG